jgi:glycosyltransferase involved in cell wall biosynthesis
MGVSLEEDFTPDPSVRRNFDEILFVGRLVEKKGLHHLLDAMPFIVRQRPTAFLTVVGFGPDEPILRRKVSELGLKNHVSFAGGVRPSELPQLYRRAGVLVAPFTRAGSGDQEGLGLVAVEAIGCGCPVVIGDVPSVTDVLGAYSETVTIDARDANALAARVLSICANPDEAVALALTIRSDVARRFDWERVATEYASVLRQIDCLRRSA